jgi:hypothetical protein
VWSVRAMTGLYVEGMSRVESLSKV